MTIPQRAKMQIEGLQPKDRYQISLHTCKSEASETDISLRSFFGGAKVWNTECLLGITLSSMVHTKIIKKQTLKNLEFSRQP